ncbi:MAG: hypothetical protein HYW90_00945 [Candidatus Sungbacteria bacterium]|nr:hypothetical protein [Candidatus Sungbacteria bacterium]
MTKRKILLFMVSVVLLVAFSPKTAIGNQKFFDTKFAFSLLDKPELVGIWETDSGDAIVVFTISEVTGSNFAGTYMVKDPTEGARDVYPVVGQVQGRKVLFAIRTSSGNDVQYRFIWDGVDTLKGGPAVADERIYRRDMPMLR